jgi:hypothetical protein
MPDARGAATLPALEVRGLRASARALGLLEQLLILSYYESADAVSDFEPRDYRSVACRSEVTPC